MKKKFHHKKSLRVLYVFKKNLEQPAVFMKEPAKKKPWVSGWFFH
jgi:hypothetical protein